MIARQLDLPIGINIITVPNDYRAQNSSNRFDSRDLAKVHPHGLGNEGIIAQVNIPGSLPFYGSSTLIDYPIDVKVSENCRKSPGVFIMIMAHELSHVLLYSLRHPQKDNELYTDLLAMMLGFQTIFRNARKITTTQKQHDFMSPTIITITVTYGYLSDEQFNFAYNKINSILEKIEKEKDFYH